MHEIEPIGFHESSEPAATELPPSRPPGPLAAPDSPERASALSAADNEELPSGPVGHGGRLPESTPGPPFNDDILRQQVVRGEGSDLPDPTIDPDLLVREAAADGVPIAQAIERAHTGEPVERPSDGERPGVPPRDAMERHMAGAAGVAASGAASDIHRYGAELDGEDLRGDRGYVEPVRAPSGSGDRDADRDDRGGRDDDGGVAARRRP